MTGTEKAAARRERFDQVVAVLTEAARAGVDMADFLARAAAAAAANLGGIEQLLAGRPGSWEADLVRQLVAGTVGWDSEYLWEHRTEPIMVRVHVEDILTDLGIAGLYEQAHDELDGREDVIFARHADDPITAGSADDLWLDRLHRQRDQLDAQQVAEWTAYGQAFAEHVRQAAGELFPDLTVPVEVAVTTDWQPGLDSGDNLDGPQWRLWEIARQRTPLPGSGIPLADYPPGADIAETEREAARDPLTRIAGGGAGPAEGDTNARPK